jgi:hypothetical protein
MIQLSVLGLILVQNNNAYIGINKMYEQSMIETKQLMLSRTNKFFLITPE